MSFISQVTKHSLETALIKKAHQALLHSRTEVDELKEENNFSFLPNSAPFLVSFDDENVCMIKWPGKIYLKDCVLLDEMVVRWIHQSKKDKRSFYMRLMHFIFIWNMYKMLLLFDVIQTISQMENGMIGQ